MDTRLRKYQKPSFLELLEQSAYERWLHRRALAHVKRDRKRGNSNALIAKYKSAIHEAVIMSEGRDAYTDERLDWKLVSTWDNSSSKLESRRYKAGFAVLPTVDHVGDGLGPADFRICSWRTNDAKNDLGELEFVKLCRLVVEFSKSKELTKMPRSKEGEENALPPDNLR